MADDKLRSLADVLGAVDPTKPDEPPPAPSVTLTTMRAFAKGILSSQQYRDSLMRRILMDELPPAVECLLYHYAAGKPTERVEITDTSARLDGLSWADLEARAASLLVLARQRQQDDATDAPAEAVH